MPGCMYANSNRGGAPFYATGQASVLCGISITGNSASRQIKKLGSNQNGYCPASSLYKKVKGA